MPNPLPSEVWGRLASGAAAIREGDLRRIGELDLLLAELKAPEESAAAAPIRRLLAEMMTADGAHFRDLHGALQRSIGEVIGKDRPAPAAVNENPADRELFLEFVEESLIHLKSIELNILAMESEPGNRKYIDNIFRPFHTIKGVAGFLNLRPIHEVCHSLENLLDDARRGQIAIMGEVSDLVLESVDFLQGMIESCRHSERPQASLTPYEKGAATFLARVTRVREAALRPSDGGAEQLASQMAADPAPAPQHAVAVAEQASLPVSNPVQAAGDPQAAQAASTGAAPDPAASAPAHAAEPEHEDPAPFGHPPDSNPPVNKGEARNDAATGDARIKQGADSTETVRVRVGLLNQLMNLAGELVLGRNQLLQKLSDRADQVAGLNAILQHVDRVTSEVQEAVMQTRMQPIGGLFLRFHRVTRDLARSLGKQIELRVSGESVELDKSLIEALADPLTHLIRNCADHGIERPEVRQARGKRPTGSIALTARQEGGKVRVIVSDDGAGVNLERVRDKAREKGIATREQLQQMTEREVLQLLFAPGFSTAEAVTGVSGRGVGMDVVRQNIERIGGTVDIETRPGEGTTFRLDLPLTLAIIPALIVTAAEQRFAIPQVNLLELVHLQGAKANSDLLHVGETEAYRLRGSMLPLLRLTRVLGLSGNGGTRTDELSIAIVAAGEKQFGIAVDRIYDTEEIVVKPLGNLLKHLPLYAGATLMGDGRPALILDMAGLGKAAHLTLQEETTFGARAASQESAERGDEQTLLLFTIHPDDQFAVPLALVSRLEEVPRERIVDSLQGKVIPYRGRLLPLVMLEDLAPIAKPPPERDRVTVIVFEIEREVGLVVTRIVDAVQVPVHLDAQSLATKGFAGISLVQDRPTSFVDIYQVIEQAYPQWFQREKAARHRSFEPERVTILLAEDSGFYRTVEKNYLVQEGFNVIDAEDGAQALELLRSDRVDLVVTDIEMPNVNGFELTRRIRANPEWRDLPVIAVTSLANDSDREAGRQAGVNAYLVKLQREQLIQEVTRLLNQPDRSQAQHAS